MVHRFLKDGLGVFALATVVASAVCAEAAPPSNAAIKLPPIPQKTIDAAIAVKLMRFDRGAPGTDSPWNGGSPVVLALAAWQGNTSADKRLLEQIRYVLLGKNCLGANGGYPAQHEQTITCAFVLARATPRIWNALSADEKAKVDLQMKAALVASAFVSSDTSGGAPHPRGIDGDTNLSREWNPNHREGEIGAMIPGTIYFGGAAAAHGILDAYDHEAYVAQLKDAGLDNTYTTFTWQATHPDSKAPDGKTIAAGIKNYRYLEHDLSDLMRYYCELTIFAYNGKVGAGLNDGKGYKDTGAGRIVSGAEGLPNKGKLGMLQEFDGKDAAGPRSSISYAFAGFRPNLFHQLILVTGGYWKRGPQADECIARINIGATDLFYKLEHGYHDYAKGSATVWGANKSIIDINSPGWSFGLARSVWEDVLKPYHADTAALPQGL